MGGKERGAIARIFGFLWQAVDGLRRLVMNLLFLLVLGLLIAALLVEREDRVVDGSVLVLHPTGQLVEQVSVADPLGLLQRGSSPQQTMLRDVLDALDAARADPRIKGLAIETDGLDGAGLSKLQEVQVAIDRFRAAGKPVLAWGSHFTQGQYYLGSLADEVHMAPDGFVLLQGFASYPTYYKGLLDKLGVRVHVFRVGTFKSAVEPYTRAGMSPEDRRASQDLLDTQWAAWRDGVATHRHLGAQALDQLVDDYPGRLAAAGGDAARVAVDAGLVDRLLAADEWEALLRERFGDSADGTGPRRTGLHDYLASVRGEQAQGGDTIAVVAVQGTIVDGEQPPGVAGGDTVARLLKQVRDDDQVKALVLRIDSPGGSVFASERIRREVQRVREAGKPVVASMSSLAASGGYWVAMGADEVWAGAATVTGSIGIFGLFPDLSEPLGRIGLSVDGVGTSPAAGGLDPRRPLSPAVSAALQAGVENGYRRFIDLVVKARGMRPEAVEAVAEGRVWSGSQAIEKGLVDHLGGLGDAVAAAARRAGVETYRVEWVEPRLSARDEILERLLRAGGGEADDVRARAAPWARVIGALQEEFGAMLRWNDPFDTYAHCLCVAP